MPRRTSALLTLLALLAPISAAGALGSAEAHAPNAGSPARAPGPAWHTVSAGSAHSLAEITTARTPDGVVHAFYQVDGAGNSGAVEHAAISASGQALAHSTVVALDGGVAGISPAMVTPSGGLRVAFAGLGATPAGDGRMAAATSDATGAAWTIGPEALTGNTTAYAGYGLGATVLSDGTPVSATTLNSEISWRVGAIATTDPELRNTAPADAVTSMGDSCCMYYTTLVNSGDAVWMAWFQNGTGAAKSGVFVQQIHPTVGPVLQAPGSSQDGGAADPSQRVAMVARPGGGVVVAYQHGDYLSPDVALWQVGSGAPTVVPGSGGGELVSLSATAAGRLWVGWVDGSSTVQVARTGTSGFATGLPASVGKTAAGGPWALTVDGDDTSAIVLANDKDAGQVKAAVVLPGVTVKPSAKSLTQGKKKKLTIKVTEGGLPLAQVKVKVKGAGAKGACTTNAQGVCKVRVKPKKAGKVKVTATRAGYTTRVATLKVKRAKKR